MPSTAVAAPAPLAWDGFAAAPGVYDVAGALPDGRLLLATDFGLELLDPAGGSPTKLETGYRPEGGIEDYAVLGSGLTPQGASCAFTATTAYVLQTKPPAVLAVDTGTGSVTTLARVAGVEKLNAIAFDRSGRFGDRLLVGGPHGGDSVVTALDCAGRASVVTSSAPRLEGGFAVAPPGFGPFGGALIASDEFSGTIFAIRAEGTVEPVASGLPAGSDLGPEAEGFVPPGFAAGGAAYVADYDVRTGAHPGTGAVRRIDSAALVGQGVAEGDLLVADEGGGSTYAIHCGASATCSSPRLVAEADALSHLEGHLAFVAEHPGPLPRQLGPAPIGEAQRGGLSGALPYAVGILVLGALLFLYWRQAMRRR